MIISESRFFCFSFYVLPNYLRRGICRLHESWKQGPGSWSCRQDGQIERPKPAQSARLGLLNSEQKQSLEVRVPASRDWLLTVDPLL